MKLIDVIGNGQKDTLGQYIFFSPVKISAEIHILFYNGKTSLGLNASVHSELCPLTPS